MEKAKLKEVQKRYESHLDSEGGIFSTIYRKRLLKITGVSGRAGTLADFWHDVRTYVKNALVDLGLFVETADKNDVDKVITAETLKPFANSFFHIAFPDQATPERAKVASLLVRNGLTYLADANKKHMDITRKGAIDQVLGLVDYLVGYIERGENK